MSDAANAPHPHVGKADLPEIERRILEYWAADRTFETSVEQRPVDTEGPVPLDSNQPTPTPTLDKQPRSGLFAGGNTNTYK